MAKKAAKQKPEKETPRVINKKERSGILIKFSEKDLKKKKEALSELLLKKNHAEMQIENAKETIKDLNYKIREFSREVESGGKEEYKLCDVKVLVDEKKKQFFFEGEMVKEEEMDDNDLQFEIEEFQEEQEEEEEPEEVEED